MAQPVFTPPISNCWCGAKARVIDWDFKMMYRVMCENNHILSKECGTKHRAICKWNSRVEEKRRSLMFDIVDRDIRNHAHNEGVLADKEMAWESRSSELFSDFLQGQNNDLYEELGVWYMEDNEPDNEWLRNMMIAYEKSDNGYLLELARDMMKQVRERAGKIAEEQATNEIYGE